MRLLTIRAGRVHFCGLRVHHGLPGLIGAIVCRRWWQRVVCVSLLVHDRADWPFPFRDRPR